MSPLENKLDQIVAQARLAREQRERGYREQALKMFPHVCGRCTREFNRKNLHELTVHHRDHNHSNNPPDGSNWELLCIYCHDNEHQRLLEAQSGVSSTTEQKTSPQATHNPFANLKDMLKDKE